MIQPIAVKRHSFLNEMQIHYSVPRSQKHMLLRIKGQFSIVNPPTGMFFVLFFPENPEQTLLYCMIEIIISSMSLFWAISDACA